MPNRSPGTGERVSLWYLNQSSPPNKCRSHLGFSLGINAGVVPWEIRSDLGYAASTYCAISVTG